jgi:hypothetical protein
MPHSRLLTALCIDLFREFPVTEFEDYLIINRVQFNQPENSFIIYRCSVGDFLAIPFT